MTAGDLDSLLHPPAWHQRAACVGAHPDLFFRVDGEPQESWDLRATVTIERYCRGCPVRQDCLNNAIESREVATDGIWGGVDFPHEYRRARRLLTRAIAPLGAAEADPVPRMQPGRDTG